MKVLIFGCTGLIGNSLYYNLIQRNNLEVIGTSRKKNKGKNIIYFNIDHSFKEITVEELFETIRPRYVINCLGITKHLIDDFHIDDIHFINSTFPKIIKKECDNYSSKLIQISTDCVYLGKKGFYSETDLPDSNDIYGQTKIAGEIIDKNHLTIRTSTVGYERSTKFGLLEWFLSQKKSCYGYKNAFFSGITTNELGNILYDYVLHDDLLSGIYHISGSRINKHDLLEIFNKFYNKNIKIDINTDFTIDRSLDSSKFKNKTGYKVKSWETMLFENKNLNNYFDRK